MIIGIGVDIVQITRIKDIINKHNGKFQKKILTDDEIQRNDEKEIAGKFAAKEAFVKAIGTGFGKIGIKDVKVLKDKNGKPYYEISDKIKEKFLPKNYSLNLSISHDGDYAIAYAILESL